MEYPLARRPTKFDSVARLSLSPPLTFMKEFTNYFILGFNALLPLINPPGNALEVLSVVGIREAQPYKVLARKIAVNTTLFLFLVALAGPYALQFFGISIEVLQLVGGAVLAAMGWQLLNKPDDKRETQGSDVLRAPTDSASKLWQSRAFYPLTFPITVGPGSVTVILTLSAQAKTLDFSARIPAFLGLAVCVVLLSALLYLFCGYAPTVAARVPSALVHGVLRIIAFLLICIGVQIASHGVHALMGTNH
jgi:multiple antibiotic resistance protein